MFGFLESERKTWLEHTLLFDERVRSTGLQWLNAFQDGQPLVLAWQPSTYLNIAYNHYFITDHTHFFEFGAASLNIYDARVNVNTIQHSGYEHDPVSTQKVMNDDIRRRMKELIGLRNYSLFLRNCEHVARYVWNGNWLSLQTSDHSGTIRQLFQRHVLGDQLRMVNSFPVGVRPHIYDSTPRSKLYSFINQSIYEAVGVDYYLDPLQNTFNVLVLGPTGSGKSNLVNAIINQQLCLSAIGHRSVTKDVSFVRAHGRIHSLNHNVLKQREIVLADTNGLCDTDLTAQEAFEWVEGRVNHNMRTVHIVIVVISSQERLTDPIRRNIKQLLLWLKYPQHHNRFFFVCTFAEDLEVEDKARLTDEMRNDLQLSQEARIITVGDGEVASIVHVGFPPEEVHPDHEKVLQSYSLLRGLLTVEAASEPIQIQRQWCTFL